jgi:hypothetical protein
MAKIDHDRAYREDRYRDEIARWQEEQPSDIKRMIEKSHKKPSKAILLKQTLNWHGQSELQILTFTRNGSIFYKKRRPIEPSELKQLYAILNNIGYINISYCNEKDLIKFEDPDL